MTDRDAARSLRGALLGTGSIAVHHMRAWQSVEHAHIVALSNRTRERALRLGAEFGIPDAHIYADYRELLSSEALDFVDIATAPDMHYQQVLAAAAHGAGQLCTHAAPFRRSVALRRAGRERSRRQSCDLRGPAGRI